MITRVLVDMAKDQDVQYPTETIDSLEFSWGKGFLSPGGADEVKELVGPISLKGLKVLDIGSGTSGVDIVLASDLGAAEVLGIDVEPELVKRGQELIAEAGLSHKVTAECIQPGPLPFDEEHFDVVFSKDSLIHIVDKPEIYKEMYRVCKSGGYLIIGDWFGDGEPRTEAFDAYAEAVGLSLALAPIEEAVTLAKKVGFQHVEGVDRHNWYLLDVQEEHERVSNVHFDKLVDVLGYGAAKERVEAVLLRKNVVEAGQLRPGHIRARKPNKAPVHSYAD